MMDKIFLVGGRQHGRTCSVLSDVPSIRTAHRDTKKKALETQTYTRREFTCQGLPVYALDTMTDIEASEAIEQGSSYVAT